MLKLISLAIVAVVIVAGVEGLAVPQTKALKSPDVSQVRVVFNDELT